MLRLHTILTFERKLNVTGMSLYRILSHMVNGKQKKCWKTFKGFLSQWSSSLKSLYMSRRINLWYVFFSEITLILINKSRHNCIHKQKKKHKLKHTVFVYRDCKKQKTNQKFKKISEEKKMISIYTVSCTLGSSGQRPIVGISSQTSASVQVWHPENHWRPEDTIHQVLGVPEALTCSIRWKSGSKGYYKTLFSNKKVWFDLFFKIIIIKSLRTIFWKSKQWTNTKISQMLDMMIAGEITNTPFIPIKPHTIHTQFDGVQFNESWQKCDV